MRIEKYGIVLSSLKENEIELVRNWRNKPHVKSAMIFQEEISPEMQKKWFYSLTENDHYLLISVENHPIGMVHVKNINWEKKSGEAGIFIGDETYLKTMYPIAAVLTMMDTFFEELKFEELTATVRNDNPEILEFNRQLGYELISKDSVSTRLKVEKQLYLKATKKIRAILNRNPF